MAKALQTAGAIVASVASVIPGPWQPFAIAASIALNVGGMLLQKKPPVLGSMTNVRIASDNPSPYSMGRTYVGGTQNSDIGWGPTIKDVPNPYRTMVLIWNAAGPSEAIEAFQADFATVTFAGGNAVGHYKDKLYLRTQLGACPEPAALISPFGYPPNWSAQHRLSGKTAGMITLADDREGKTYSGGVPAFGAIGRWALVYDQRRDSSFPGGSGACRVANETTYIGGASGENPSCHGVTYAIGRWQNGKKVMGLGLARPGVEAATPYDAARAIDWPAWTEFANVCDANNWKVGGSVEEPGFRWDNLKRICAAGGGRPLWVGGKLTVIFPRPRVAIDTIRDRDLAGPIRVPGMRTWRTRKNILVPRVRLESHKWEHVQIAEVRNEVLIALDGQEESEEFQLELVQQADQGAELAAYELMNRRELGPIVLPLKPRWRNYRPGDAVNVHIPSEGLVNQLCVITGRRVDAGAQGKPPVFELTLETENTAKHAFALGQTGTPPAPITLVAGADIDAASMISVGEVAGLAPIATDAGAKTKLDGVAPGATKNRPFRQVTDPALNSANAVVDGDTWIDISSTPMIVKERIGGTWQFAANYITDTNQITDGAGLGERATFPNITGSIPLNDPRITNKTLANLDLAASQALASAKGRVEAMDDNAVADRSEKTASLIPFVRNSAAAHEAIDAKAELIGTNAPEAMPSRFAAATAGVSVAPLAAGVWRVTDLVADTGAWNAAVLGGWIDGDVVLRVVPLQAGVQFMAGFNDIPVGGSWQALKHNLFFDNDQTVYVTQQGVNLAAGVWAPNESFWLLRRGGVVEYRKGATLAGSVLIGQARAALTAAPLYPQVITRTQGVLADVRFDRLAQVGFNLTANMSAIDVGGGIVQLEKTGGDVGYNAGAFSGALEGDVALRFEVPASQDINAFAGFQVGPANGTGIGGTTFAVYAYGVAAPAGLQFYESGNLRFEANDFRVGEPAWLVRETVGGSTSVTLRRGPNPHTATVVYTSLAPYAGPLYVNSSFNVVGARLRLAAGSMDYFRPALERGAVVAARRALEAYLRGLAPPWDDAGVDTPIDRATLRNLSTAYSRSLDALQAANAERASKISTWEGTADPNGTKPENNATVGSTIGTNTKLPDGSIPPAGRLDNDQMRLNGGGDGIIYLSRELSPGFYGNVDQVWFGDVGADASLIAETGGRKWAAETGATVGGTIGVDVRIAGVGVAPASRLDNDQLRISASAGVVYIARELAGGGFANVDQLALSEAGISGLAYKSAVDLASPDVLNKSLANVDQTASNKLGGIQAGADVTALNTIEVAAPADQRVQAASDGTVPAGTFPRDGGLVAVTRGGASIRTDAGTSFAATFVNGTGSINNSAGDPDKGRVTWNSMAADSAYVEITVTVNGQAQPAKRQTLSKARASSTIGSPPTGGAGDGPLQNSDTLDPTLTGASSVVVAGPFPVRAGAGGKITLLLDVQEYYLGGASTGSVQLIASLHIRAEGSGSYLLVGAEQTGSAAFVSGGEPYPGSLVYQVDATGLTAGNDYEVLVMGRASNTRSITIASGYAQGTAG